MSAVWSILNAVAAVALVISVLALVAGHWSAWRHLAKGCSRKVPGTSPPSVSILKPVEGANSHTYGAFASFCRQDYPGSVELLVGTLATDDPIVSVVQQLQHDFPDQKIRLIQAPLRGTNRKTSIMEALWREAAGELLFFSDADVVVGPDYLQCLVAEFNPPEVGCVTCLPRGIRADSLGARLIALHYDFNYLPQWMLARWTTGIAWAIGHTMAVRRTVLEAMDGFLRFLDHLADDYELGHRTVQQGLRVRVAPLLLDCTMPQESLADAGRRLLRWKRTMRRARGPAFAGAALTYPVSWAACLVVLNPCAGWAWMTLGATVLFRVLLAAGLQRRVRMPDWPRAWWLLPWADLLEGLTFVGAYTGNTITWAGRRYWLQRDGTLLPLDSVRG